MIITLTYSFSREYWQFYVPGEKIRSLLPLRLFSSSSGHHGADQDEKMLTCRKAVRTKRIIVKMRFGTVISDTDISLCYHRLLGRFLVPNIRLAVDATAYSQGWVMACIYCDGGMDRVACCFHKDAGSVGLYLTIWLLRWASWRP